LAPKINHPSPAVEIGAQGTGWESGPNPVQAKVNVIRPDPLYTTAFRRLLRDSGAKRLLLPAHGQI
jgi:hypothetical protein